VEKRERVMLLLVPLYPASRRRRVRGNWRGGHETERGKVSRGKKRGLLWLASLPLSPAKTTRVDGLAREACQEH